MAKVAKFDRQNVVDKATALYWQKGFHATSMRNLQDVIDLRPGSIYTAFGSKEQLFKEVLENYKQSGIAMLAKCRAVNPSPLAALKAFVRYVVIESRADAPSSICMLSKTLAELTGEQQILLDTARKALAEVEFEFEKLIIDAQHIGEVDKSKDPARLASHIQIQIAGLRIYAKAKAGSAPLEQLIDDMFKHYPF